MQYVRGAIKIPLFVLASLLAYVLLAGCDVLKLGAERKARTKQFLYRIGMAVFSVRLICHGTLAKGPALLVANHCSYMDVLLLASRGEMRFTPKSDVRSWPLIGPLVTRFDVLYVDRAPGKTREMQQALLAALRGGGRICVFPEATTNDGRHLLPFKSSLFSLAEQWEGAEPLTVQPVSVLYRTVDGKPIDDASWPKVAWYGDSGIVSHLSGFLSLQRVEAELYFHEPIALCPGETRKELCARAEAAVKAPFVASLSPRRMPGSGEINDQMPS